MIKIYERLDLIYDLWVILFTHSCRGHSVVFNAYLLHQIVYV